MSPPAVPRARRHRNHKFDLLRPLFATSVLLVHAPELTDGDSRREILTRLLRTPFNLGALGVDGFFLLSGFLIVRSWQGNPELGNLLRKRLLSIVPGYVVAAIVVIPLATPPTIPGASSTP